MTQHESESGSDSDTDSDSENESDADSSPAKAGVIEKIVLKNFMCHDSFELNLGPQLNFIIGRNGSGKSAVLTGISVGLGVKASDTSRGSSIKNLIKDGKSTARVTIVFKNEGIEAYKPEEFGSKIVIERKIQRQGANGYFIRSENLKTISTKKSVLDEILYKFNITVDNPLAFLSQDKAREFLTLTTDQVKYEYFMAGSLINDIMDNYRITSGNIVEIQNKLKLAKTHLDVAVKKFEDSASLYNKFKKSDTLRKQLELVHGKIYWFNVRVIEKKIEKYRGQLEHAHKDIESINQKLADIEEKTEYRKSLRTELEESSDSAAVELTKAKDSYDEQRDVYQRLKNGINDIINEIKRGEEDIVAFNIDIEKCKETINKEQHRIDEINGGSKEKLSGRLTELKKDLEHSETERQNVRTQLNELENLNDLELSTCEKDLRSSKESMINLQEKKKRILESQKDKYSPWGNNITRLLAHIKSIDKWHQQPIGPIGAFVSVKEEYSDWRDLMNVSIGKTLDSFLVCDEHDRRILNDLFRKYRINKNIITRKFEKFNFENGIANGYTTFLDVLSIDNENVLYTLIDSNNIEKNIITNNRNDARSIVTNNNVMNVFSLLNYKSGQRSSGDTNSFRIDPVYYRLNEPHKLSNGSGSSAKEIQKTDEQIDNEIERINKLERRKRELKMKRQNERQNLENDYHSIQKAARKINDEIFNIENSLNENGDLSKIEALKAQITGNESQITQKEGILESLNEDLENGRTQFLGIRQEVSRIKQEVQEKSKLQDELKTRIVEFEIEGSALISEAQHYEMTKDKRQDTIRMCESKISQGEEKLAPLITDAEARCSRNQVNLTDEDTHESITCEYESIQEAIKEAEKALGRSYEEIQEELLSNKNSKEASEERVIDLDKIYRSLSEDLNSRFNYMHTTILKNISEASSSFERSLALRGFKGDLKFDFSEKSLTMLVQTKGDSKKRTVESLSGGEKSFTQIALLLAIWKVMDSKVRGLDEFDVFMDSVNRSISIKLLLSELRQYPKSQSIFITPQDIAVVGDLDSKDVRIHKMDDPRSNN